MKSSKLKFGLHVCAGVIAGLWFGCSNTTGPSYPLTLTLLSHTQNPIYDTLQFQVTKSGKAVAGAGLISTTSPYYLQTNLKITSDSTGKYPPLPITFNDSFTVIAYQAEIDSLTSNPIKWSWF